MIIAEGFIDAPDRSFVVWCCFNGISLTQMSLMVERSLQTSDTGVNIRYKGFKEITKGTERYGKNSDH